MKNLSTKYQPWVDARKRYHLSHAHIQMARELGLNPKTLGSLADCDQEPWKAPLPDFIARIYQKRFGKERPDDVRPLEEILADRKQRKAERKEQKRHESEPPPTPADNLTDPA